MKNYAIALLLCAVAAIGYIIIIEYGPAPWMSMNALILQVSAQKIITLSLVSTVFYMTKGIDLLLGDASEFLEIGDTLISDIEATLQAEVNAQILPLKNKAEELIGSIDSVMMIVATVLNKDTRENLRNSLQSLDKTFLVMSSTMFKVDSLVNINDERISRVVRNLESITTNLESSNGEIKTILTNFASLSDSLAKANIAETLRNVSEITSKINNGEGSLGLLLKDDQLYANFEKSTRELGYLLEDIKNNPSRYVNFSIIGGGKPYVEPKSK